MLSRRYFGSLLLLGACTRPSRELKEVLPVQIQRSWILKEAHAVHSDEVPDVVRSLGLDRALEARYEGNGNIRVSLYRMKVETSAFELIQKWRQSEGLAVYKGPYFVVAKGDEPDRATVASFLQALRDNLK